MARGKQRTVVAKDGGLPAFVNVTLSQDDRVAMKTLDQSVDGLVDWLELMARDGYRIGLSWNSERSAYICSVTARDTGTPNDGKCVTSFAPTVMQVVFVAWYKHVHILGAVWLDDTAVLEGSFG